MHQKGGYNLFACRVWHHDQIWLQVQLAKQVQILAPQRSLSKGQDKGQERVVKGNEASRLKHGKQLKSQCLIVQSSMLALHAESMKLILIL